MKQLCPHASRREMSVVGHSQPLQVIPSETDFKQIKTTTDTPTTTPGSSYCEPFLQPILTANAMTVSH